MDEQHRHVVDDLRYIATKLRRHCLRMTSAAGSGHPTTCLSAADLVAALFFHALRFDVAHPDDPRNDRVVLSKGHGAPLLYAAWAEAGGIPVEQLLSLRQFDSPIEGHPTPRFPFVRAATGSLGQGLSIGLGMAQARRIDAADYRVFVLLGDGEVAEGAVWEAAALAAHDRIDHLVGIVDVNRLGQRGPTMLGHDVEAYARRFAAFGWVTLPVDGHDMGAVLAAFEAADAIAGQPVMILARTIKGKGVSFLEGREGWHGKALDADDELPRALAELELEGEDPGLRVRVRPPRASTRPAAVHADGPAALPLPAYARGDEVATRTAYGTALEKLGAADPRVVVIDGDVGDSTRAGRFAEAFPDRFLQGYIAEQNMAGMAVGLQAQGKRPFVATFACFLTRAFDLFRMAAIGRARMVVCGSHAGVSIGQDGPSQMGLEDLAMMRALPGGVVLYPGDAVAAERMVELAAAHDGIAYIRTTRPKTPVLYANDQRFAIGGSVVWHPGGRDVITIVAAGITLHQALAAREVLARSRIAARVVDLYSVKPLDRDTLLACAAETNHHLLTVEDHYPEGGLGEAVLAAVGDTGCRVDRLAVRAVPRSGQSQRLLDAYGIGADAIVDAVRRIAAEQAPRRAAAR